MPTLHPGHQRAAIWVFDNSAGAYIDNSIEARSPTGTAFSIFADTADFLYIGLENRFDLAIFFLAANGSIGLRTWQYYDGNSWNTFVPGTEYDFSGDGAERFDRLINWNAFLFTATSPHAATPPDNITRYWIRCQVASVTTAPTVNRVVLREYAAYATADDVANILQLGYKFASDTIPTKHVVEDYIHNAQSQIDFLTRKSWRPNIAYDEEHEFNRSGFQTIKNYPTNILELRIWNGAEFELKTGPGILNNDRTNDYFLVQNTGMVHFSRFFILPARIQSYGAALWGWGFGEFSHPIRITYIHGSNIYDNEREGGTVNDLAKKMAALDVLHNTDYTLIPASGTDKIDLDRKSDLWRSEMEDKIESLKSWEIF